jgi:hypothetical protein
MIEEPELILFLIDLLRCCAQNVLVLNVFFLSGECEQLEFRFDKSRSMTSNNNDGSNNYFQLKISDVKLTPEVFTALSTSNSYNYLINGNSTLEIDTLGCRFVFDILYATLYLRGLPKIRHLSFKNISYFRRNRLTSF